MQNNLKRVEVTLELMPTLQRTYTPPSIKVLFPQNQCKFSFCKFSTKSIKTYTSQYNRNMIHNLPNHTLTEDEFSVLTKDLPFVSNPIKTFKHDTNRSWDQHNTRMLTQYFFCNNNYDKAPLSRRNPTRHPLPLTTPP